MLPFSLTRLLPMYTHSKNTVLLHFGFPLFAIKTVINAHATRPFGAM